MRNLQLEQQGRRFSANAIASSVSDGDIMRSVHEQAEHGPGYGFLGRRKCQSPARAWIANAAVAL